jgi:hypothetical protein
MLRFVVLIFTDATGSQTAVASGYRFATRQAAEVAANFFREFTPHVLVIEDI